MFTSTTLAHAKISEIREILRSEEYKEHPELFTSTILCKKYEHIKNNFKLARKYNIDEKYITTKFLMKPVWQNYALINWLKDNNKTIIENGKLNSIFSYMPGIIKKKFNVDLKELKKMYPLEEKEETILTEEQIDKNSFKKGKRLTKQVVVEQKGNLEANKRVERELFEETIIKIEDVSKGEEGETLWKD